MKKLSVILVDDEPLGINDLKDKLESECDVNVLEICSSSTEALEKIPLLEPDVVFLDIELDHLTGFDVLDQLKKINFEIVFLTKHNNYASQSYEVGAIYYALKPYSISELKEAVSKIISKKVHEKNEINKIAIPTMEGMSFIPINDIIYCQASNTYTYFVLNSGRKLVTSKTLKFFQDKKMAYYHNFFRAHRTYLINLNHADSYDRGEGYVTMSNGDSIPLGKEQKKQFKNLWN